MRSCGPRSSSAAGLNTPSCPGNSTTTPKTKTGNSHDCSHRPGKKAAAVLDDHACFHNSHHPVLNNLFTLPRHLRWFPVHLFHPHYPVCVSLSVPGSVFSLGISTVYILLVYFYSGFNSQAVAVSTAWFVVFVTIGVVTSTFAEGLREEELKYLGIFENSQAGIFTFDLDTHRLAEVNGKCAQMLRYERPELTGADLSRIMTGKESRERFVRQIREHRKTG